MKILHVAIATHDIDASIADYSERLGEPPCTVVPNAYALWRTAAINLSIRLDTNCQPGELRHLGFEDASASAFTASRDVNGILWESFTAAQQADEINQLWPATDYQPDKLC